MFPLFLIVLALGKALQETDADEPLRLPQVPLADLARGLPSAANIAREALSSLGALVVTEAKDSSRALDAWAKCLQTGGRVQQDGRALVRPLAGGSIRRSTVAAQDSWGAGRSLAALPFCPEASQHEDDMRLNVRAATRALVSALAGLSDASKEMVSLNASIEVAEHLEHLHLYEEESRKHDQQIGNHQALDFHTDAGLLLAFVPPRAATGNGEALFLQVEGADEKRRNLAPIPEGAVTFFAGEAARLLSRHTAGPHFRPLPHALSLPVGFKWRAWYGVMLLLPNDTTIRPDAASSNVEVPFGTFWEAAREHLSKPSSAHIGCGGGLKLVDQAGACPTGTLNCWMACLSTKGLESCQGGMWKPTGKGDLVEWAQLAINCREPTSGKIWPEETGSMCPTCKPVCTLPTVNVTPPAQVTDAGFCRSSAGNGLVMYMEGFKWTSIDKDSECLALFYGSLVIDGPWKLVASCAAVFFLGLVMEAFSLVRRQLPSRRQRDIGYCCHAINLCLAYLVMLVVMMYSIELFISVVLGLVIGQMLASRIGRRFSAVQSTSSCSAEVRLDTGAGSPCCRLSLGFEGTADPRRVAHNSTDSLSEKLIPLHEFLLVEGMTCGTCADTVKKALLDVDGVLEAQVDLKKNMVRVGYKPPADSSLLCHAVESVGFGATVQKN